MDLENKGCPKHKHIMVPFESLIRDEWYAITINPCDKMQMWHSLNREGECMMQLSKILNNSKNIYTYELYPEYSPKGRFHWHGRIKIHNKIIFYSSSIPHILKYSKIVIKDITSNIEWSEYCMKQEELHEYIEMNHYTKMPITNSK